MDRAFLPIKGKTATKYSIYRSTLCPVAKRSQDFRPAQWKISRTSIKNFSRLAKVRVMHRAGWVQQTFKMEGTVKFARAFGFLWKPFKMSRHRRRTKNRAITPELRCGMAQWTMQGPRAIPNLVDPRQGLLTTNQRRWSVWTTSL